VTAFLRLVGILNAATWFGSAVFLTIALPAMFSEEMTRRLTAPGVGFAAEAMVARFFEVQICCGAIALAHLAAEWLYAGRPPQRLKVGLAMGLLGVALAGGLWAQPKMQKLHKEKYYGRTVEQQTQAARAFAVWHGASETVNMLVIGGLILYLWSVSGPSEHARYSSFGKIRS
jgi:hypothetical protein